MWNAIDAQRRIHSTVDNSPTALKTTTMPVQGHNAGELAYDDQRMDELDEDSSDADSMEGALGVLA
jgi:hypothetical protein